MKALLLLLVTAACSRAPHVAYVEVAPIAALSPAPVFEPEPHRGRVVVTETDIEILDTITFIGNTAQLAPTSSRILDAVARTMLGNPGILMMEVRGHSDWEEPDRQVRAQLSIARAEAVISELVARGVAATRLQAYGASDSEPISTTDAVKNRRIEFIIVERDRD